MKFCLGVLFILFIYNFEKKERKIIGGLDFPEIAVWITHDNNINVTLRRPPPTALCSASPSCFHSLCVFTSVITVRITHLSFSCKRNLFSTVGWIYWWWCCDTSVGLRVGCLLGLGRAIKEEEKSLFKPRIVDYQIDPCRPFG